jgi:hypothetical protein
VVVSAAIRELISGPSCNKLETGTTFTAGYEHTRTGRCITVGHLHVWVYLYWKVHHCWPVTSIFILTGASLLASYMYMYIFILTVHQCWLARAKGTLHSPHSGFSCPQDSTRINHCSSDVSSKEGAVIVSTWNAHRGQHGLQAQE